MIGGHLTHFHYKRVVDFREAGDIVDFGTCAPCVRCEPDDQRTIVDHLALMVDQPGAAAIEALVIGLWCEGGEAVDARPDDGIDLLLTRHADLPNLKALFVGDIISEELEISWIKQGDLCPLWDAFPKLEEFGARGGNGLRLGVIESTALRKLVIESGGLPGSVVQEVLEADAPLQHLELWLGARTYGASSTVDDFRALMDGKLFPELRYLGLLNCEYTDDLAEALAVSPVLERIETLDLSLGTLTDRGAQALLDSGKLGSLQTLDLRHHYMSDAMRERLRAATPKLIAGLAECYDPWYEGMEYFVAVSE